jgi:NAD(P)-dependent dehydrogenase (short-subunit alcohol dehydrogenase family)
MNPFNLQGKTILVTGASSGIGRQVALSVTESGGKVVITGRDPQRLNETYNRLTGGGHQKIISDLTDDMHVDALIEQLPQLNGAVFSAGITTHMPVKFIRKKDISQIFGINYESIVLTTSYLLKKKKLLDNSSLLFLSSVVTRFTYFGGALYTGTKAAIESYSKVLALELAPKRIRSNCLSPTFVNTPMVEGAGKTISQEVLERYEKMSPLGFGEPADVANAAVFFLSDASKWITGANLVMGAIV